MFSSPLQRAIEKGMEPGNSLERELYYLDRYPVHLREDGIAICKALRQLPPPAEIAAQEDYRSPLKLLASWFEYVAGRDVPAFDVLNHEGIYHLLRLVDDLRPNPNGDNAHDLMAMLRVLALYGSLEGSEKVAECAALSVLSKDYAWHGVLAPFAWQHPHQGYLFHVLGDPLPNGVIEDSLLNVANEVGNAGELSHHPFDTEKGWRKLRLRLTRKGRVDPRKALSATAALPFISDPQRDRLLQIALEHPVPPVQIQAAKVAATLGKEVGAEMLAQFCMNVHYSSLAQYYLTLLGMADRIPPDSLDDSFTAKSELSGHLSVGANLLVPPEELEVVDHRILAWPPENEPRPFWLIRYRIPDPIGLKNDRVDYGFVGVGYWNLYEYDFHRRPPDDSYAIFCFCDMEHRELIYEHDISDPTEYECMLSQWKGEPLEEVQMTHVVELSPSLNYPAGLVAAAAATRNGEDGWLVLDGPRSCWYPAADFPEERTMRSMILMVHVGRRLLGIQDTPDRQKYLAEMTSGPTPAQICKRYEAFLQEFETASPRRQEDLLTRYGALYDHFETYVRALVGLGRYSQEEAMVTVYERLLHLAENADESVREKLTNEESLLGEKFIAYVKVLSALGRVADVVDLIEKFEALWKKNYCIGRIGEAYYLAQQFDRAEACFLKLLESSKANVVSDHMDKLAEIWHRRGELEWARGLLLESLQATIACIEKQTSRTFRRIYRSIFQGYRATYLRLFPGGEAELLEFGIPENPR